MIGYVEDKMIWATKEHTEDNILLDVNVVKVWTEDEIISIVERSYAKSFQNNIILNHPLCLMKDKIIYELKGGDK